nr:hypothetical protein GCM10020092_035130 [Actinoplanes digitatis]
MNKIPVVKGSSRWGALRHRTPALVGRDDELRSAEQMLAAARAGRGGTMFVTGDGGIGKSRLAAAAADMAFAADMSLLRGRGSAVGLTMPFRSLTEALLSLVRSGDPIDVTELGPYRHALGQLIPDWADGPAAPAPAPWWCSPRRCCA